MTLNQDSEITVGMTINLKLEDTPDGKFWCARTTMADGTVVKEYGRTRRRAAAAAVYRQVAAYLVEQDQRESQS